MVEANKKSCTWKTMDREKLNPVQLKPVFHVADTAGVA
jgi:hypothetical protein